MDRGSRNGTLVHGQPVRGSGAPLRAGDIVELGNRRVRLQALPGRTREPTAELALEDRTATESVTIAVAESGRIELSRPPDALLRGTPEYLLTLLRRGAELAADAPGQESLLERLVSTGLSAVPARRGAAFLAGSSGPVPICFRCQDDPDIAAFPVPMPLIEQVLDARRSLLVEGVSVGMTTGPLDPQGDVTGVCLPVDGGRTIAGE